MRVTNELDLPIRHIAVSGPAVDALEKRKERSSNPSIESCGAARKLQQSEGRPVCGSQRTLANCLDQTHAAAAGTEQRLSIFYITEKAIARRAALLLDIARELLESGTLPAHRIILREPRIRLLTEGYFLLNKAYKDWRIPAGHSNEKIRIAALQALTITQFQPFVPVDPTDARDLTEARCNEIFALVYALVMMDAGVHLRRAGKD